MESKQLNPINSRRRIDVIEREREKGEKEEEREKDVHARSKDENTTTYSEGSRK